ncbi:MAG: TIGR02453 family protein [Phyllobacteriaceae bacterium]|nr:TIGR02453 family protein [Phyllobacteriaceae bacterium]
MAGFSGFGDKALPFLKALGFHQTKEWFHENRALYDSAIKSPMGDLIEDATARFAALGIPLKGTRTGAMFRVNRDVRFSKEKHPYNTHASAVLTRNGTKKDAGGAYIHIKPGECFVGAGVWLTEPPVLNALRRKILAFPDTFLAIEDALTAKGLPFSDEDRMKRVPADYKHVTEPRLQSLMTRRHFFVNRTIDNDAITGTAVLDALLETTQACDELFAFCWPVLDETPPAS